ncbi:hypothetical protein [Psychrobacter sp. ASPA161_9]|uniref:hypothetical protein n=1 Tax=Psychrobacter sp. ASPA161_9 TaxID=3160961 RepID=UPI003F8181AC
MIYLDIVVLTTSDSDSLDRYRTNRSIELIKGKLDYCKVTAHFAEINEVKSLPLNSELCLFLIAGDLLEVDYLEEVGKTYIPSKNIVLQPGYTYCFNKSDRKLCKNIDIHSELACYDVLALRYCASRHFVSKTSMVKDFLSNQKSLDISFIWSYLLFLLSKGHVLMSLHETVTFEIIERYFDNRSVKVFGDYSSNPPLSDDFYYPDVLRRQDINNVHVREKSLLESHMISMNSKAVRNPAVSISNLAMETNNYNKSQEQFSTKKNVSEQDVAEAIKNNGLIKGINLTKARLLNRATERFKKKNLPFKDKIKETKIDVKNTLNLK